MKYFILIALLALPLAAQNNPANGTSGVQRLYTRVHLPTDNAGGADSVLLFTLPANVELRAMTIHCDTVLTPGGSDSLKIGISGEDIPYTDTYRFADIANDSLSAGESITLSHTHYRQNNAGKLYVYDEEIDVVCTDADTYYPMTNMKRFVFGRFDTSVTGSALIAK
jgi:hypothetical protein